MQAVKTHTQQQRQHLICASSMYLLPMLDSIDRAWTLVDGAVRCRLQAQTNSY
jgi:hypothetical protein